MLELLAPPQVQTDSSGSIVETFQFNGAGIAFDAEGEPVEIAEFLVRLKTTADKTLLGIELDFPFVPLADVDPIGSALLLPVTAEELQQANMAGAYLSLRLTPETLAEVVVPALPELMHLVDLFALCDDEGRRPLLDLENYQLLECSGLMPEAPQKPAIKR